MSFWQVAEQVGIEHQGYEKSPLWIYAKYVFDDNPQEVDDEEHGGSDESDGWGDVGA